MRITHVLFGLRTGGAELMLADIMAEQVRLGHTVTLVVINRDYEDTLLREVRRSGVKVVLIGRSPSGRNPLPLLRYNAALWLTRPQVVHFHQSLTSSVTVPVPGVRYVQTVHDTALPLRPKRWISRWFAISGSVALDIKERFGLPSEVIYNGIRPDLIRRASAAGEYHPGQPFRIVVVSRLVHEKKGQDLAIEAVARLKEKYPRVQLDLVGEGPSMEHLQRLCQSLGVDYATFAPNADPFTGDNADPIETIDTIDTIETIETIETTENTENTGVRAATVNFLGNRPRHWIYNHLADYHLLLQPSRHEGFGLTVAEGMAARIPVLVSDCEGPMEIIDSGRCGYRFATGSAAACAQAIEAIMADYPAARALACGPAAARLHAHFTISATAAAYLAALQ